MTYYDEQLQMLGQQVARKTHLEAILRDLQNQRVTLDAKVKELERIKLDEQKDVDRLEGHSIAALFYAAIGKKEEKLDQELSEAYAAAAKYDVAVRELKAVNTDIAKHETELQELAGCEKEYTRILEEKAEAIKKSGTAYAEEILRIEEQIAQLENKKKEISEATLEGKAALRIAEDVLSRLNEAHDLGIWDLGRGGFLSGIAKHNALDEAQESVKTLQVQLRRFKTELADVTIHADVRVDIDDSLRSVDLFFDNFFTDWEILNKIEESQTQAKSAIRQIQEALDKLSEIRKQAQKEQNAKYNALDDFILKTKI